jgi:hypothetical protein
MAILEHLDAGPGSPTPSKLADETHRGFPGPPAATSRSRSTRFDNALQYVNDKAGRRHLKLSAAEAMVSVRGVWHVSMLAVALDPYMG